MLISLRNGVWRVPWNSWWCFLLFCFLGPRHPRNKEVCIWKMPRSSWKCQLFRNQDFLSPLVGEPGLAPHPETDPNKCGLKTGPHQTDSANILPQACCCHVHKLQKRVSFIYVVEACIVHRYSIKLGERRYMPKDARLYASQPSPILCQVLSSPACCHHR